MVDSRTEKQIKKITEIYTKKMNKQDFLIAGIDYIKQLTNILETQLQSDNPNEFIEIADLYIWSKMLLISQDISEDILDSQVDRLEASINEE